MSGGAALVLKDRPFDSIAVSEDVGKETERMASGRCSAAVSPERRAGDPEGNCKAGEGDKAASTSIIAA